MKTRALGRSGLRITEIAYGNWITHGSQVEAEIATACVHEALDLGITTFDTADVYANTVAEEVLGAALKGQRREGLELFTKVYWPTGPGRHNDSGLSRKHIMESLHGSLRRLGTDYVDLYQAHRFDDETPLEETMVAFADLVHAGKVHYLGVSEWTAEQIRAAAELARDLRVPLVSSQPQYNLLWRVIEADVVPACEELGLGQIVWSPLAQGLLTGKYPPGQELPPQSRATDPAGAGMIQRWLEPPFREAVAGLAPIAADLDVSMAQLCLAWVLSHDFVSAAIVGASRPEQLRDNVAATQLTLTSEVIEAMERVVADVVITDPALTTSPRRSDLIRG